MSRRQTLASRGFVLPTAPHVGDQLMIAIAVRDFLCPDQTGREFAGKQRSYALSVISRTARQDGFAPDERQFPTMGQAFMEIGGRARTQRRKAREAVAAWLGIPIEQIWPHHARATATPARAMRDAREADAENVEANTTPMAPMYSATGAVCNPFVHTVSKRVIGAGAALAALAAAALIAARRRGGAR